MPISEVSICNRALDMLGADPITSLDDAIKPARLLKRAFEPVRDATLRAYPWNCAMARATLSALTEAPVFEFAQQYQLPEGPNPPYCLRVWRVAGEIEGAATPYRIEGRRLLSDDGPPLQLLYIARVTDPAQFDPLLGEAIAARLAADLAYSLTGSTALGQVMLAVYQAKLIEARAVDAREGSPEEITASQWLEARR